MIPLRTHSFYLGGRYFTLCYDHVDPQTFRVAFEAERPEHQRVQFLKSELRHEWWERKTPIIWEKSEEGGENALPVTVLEW
jgi:hypothetical protein